MASPALTWKKHTGPTDTPGSAKTEVTMGTVTANSWSAPVCYSILVEDNGVQNFKLWMNDSTAVVNGTAVSLGSATKTWGIRARTTAALGTGTTAAFASNGSAWTTLPIMSLAADFKAAPSNSVGAGVSMGDGANLSVGPSSVSRYVFLSIKPHVSAYDGEHTGFTFQVGYDFS